MNNLLFIVSLGFAGIDPVGMMLLITMQTAGLSKKKAFLYRGLVLFGTAILGFILSSLLGRGLSDLASSIDNFSNTVWVWINLVLILILTAWGIKRLSAKEQKEKKTFTGKVTRLRTEWDPLNHASNMAGGVYIGDDYVIANSGSQPSKNSAII
ncbi:hypothetical protein AALH12_08205 [Streptococcus ferus]|uniref:hypothetical protein n=1 Tax=Streptococcus ferus TaxID=1345 RepID=UPI003515144F